MKALSILCWGHRRAVDPLRAVQEAFARERPDITLKIDVRPLSDFEHQGMAGVAQRYDIVVYDHPFSGDIAQEGLFVPLEGLLEQQLGGAADRLYAGPSLDSYRLNGHVWGAPIDAATQHAIYRADLLDLAGEAVPASWQETTSLGKRLRARGMWLGMAVQTPHALLTIAALMANAGKPWSTDASQPLRIDETAFADAYKLLQELLVFCPPESMDWNSIDLHDAMVSRDDVAYCPCVYGYATYGESDMRRRLSFADFAGAMAPFHAGSAIGGTAAGLSRFSALQDEAIVLLAFLLSKTVQDKTIPSHHGQAALSSSWSDAENDKRFNGFFSQVARSMDSAWVRPRHPGYITFQNEAGALVAQALRDGATAHAVAADVREHAARVRILDAKRLS